MGACNEAHVILGENFGGTVPDGGVVFDAGLVDASPPDAGASFCSGVGPAVPLPIFGDCTGDLAKKTFRFAVCACTSLDFSGVLLTDAHDSTTGVVSTTAGSVGVNGTYAGMSSSASVGGSLWTNGDTSMSAHTIAGDLECGGNLVVTGTSRVEADAFLSGGVQGALAVDGTLHIPAGEPYAGVTADGGVVVGPVTVPPPCDCAKPIDIASIAKDLEGSNQDALAGFTPDVVANVSTTTTLTLPCGRYFLTTIGGSAPLTLHVTGRAALAVGGPLIHQQTRFQVTLDPGAELDLFVAGDVQLSGQAQIGDPTRAAAMRVYVGGTFGYDGSLLLAANLYLPTGALTTTTTGTEVWGALFAQSISITGDLTVHYDPAILDVGGCAPPAASCGSCHDCANPSPACNNGVCGACTNDTDCCPPLHCSGGGCVAEIP